METYQVELQEVYKKIATNSLVNSLIGLSIFIAICFIVRRIYKEYQSKDDKDYHRLFGIAKQYILVTAFIVLFPIVLNKIEVILAGVQADVSQHFNATVEMTVDQAIIAQIEDYIEQESSVKDNNKSLFEYLNPLSGIFDNLMGIGTNTFLLQINKYLYFFFCAGRYLWLIMLEILAPLAIVCMWDEETKHYFKSWLKNMLICYLLIPFFLLADVFAEQSISLLATHTFIFSYQSHGILAVIGMLILKIALYKVAANRAFKLLD